MAYVDTLAKFHVALNGVGLMLQGAPDRLAYQQGQAPVYGQRFASGDRDYNDLSQWWYFTQTDWSGGIKESTSWLNDAKFYYSTNIDAWSKVGGLRLTKEQYPSGGGGDHDFTDDVYCGFEGEVNGTVSKFIGTGDHSDSRPHIYKAASGESQSFTDISTTTISTNQNIIAMMSARAGLLWASIIGAGSTFSVVTWNGTTWVDQTPYIDVGGGMTYTPTGSPCHVEYSGTMYVFVENSLNSQYALVKTTAKAPSANGDWTKVFEVLGTSGVPSACAAYNGKIHYLVNKTYYTEYWQYDIAAATNILVRNFQNSNLRSWSIGDKLMVQLNGKLVITIPNSEIWELDGNTLSRIYIADSSKTAIGGEASAYLLWGCVSSDNKLWWGNLMYDGENFFNTWKGDGDATGNNEYPLFSDSAGRIWESYGGDDSVIWSVAQPTGSLYKGDANKNFLVFSNFDNVAGVDKIAYSVTLLFAPLASGQKIAIEYFTGELTSSSSFTSLGSVSYSADGGSIIKKTFFFTNPTIFNKLWFKVKLEGGGTDTPTLTDVVMEYLPMPSYKKNWTLNINSGSDVKRLDGGMVETRGRELKSMLETAWWTKALIDFQDMDYATTLLNGSVTASSSSLTVDDTSDFPEQGRVKIDDEEIFYTGKTRYTFTGLTRGARGTLAAAHSDNAVVNNAYKVIITDLNTRVPISLQDKQLEYVVGVALREA